MGMGFPQLLLLGLQFIIIGISLAKKDGNDAAATVVGICIVQSFLWWGGWYDH